MLYNFKHDEKEQNLTMTEINPNLLLQGEVPRLYGYFRSKIRIKFEYLAFLGKM